MPLLTIRYTNEILSKQRPRCVCRDGHGSAYNPPAYNAWLKMQTQETRDILQGEHKGVRCDLMLYEFGLENLGLDPDNTSGAIQDSIVDADLLLTDTFLSLPISTILGFPVNPGKQFTQITMVYQGLQEDYDRYFAYRNRRELICLDLIKYYRKEFS